jgi:hypothetical protein
MPEKNEQQAKIDIKDLPVGEEARYTTEFTPTETGFYTIYAYLYDGWMDENRFQDRDDLCAEKIAITNTNRKFPTPLFL